MTTVRLLPQGFSQLPTWLTYLLALSAGALAPLSLAPFNYWPLGIVSTAVFASLIYQQNIRPLLYRSFYFALGLFGVGVSWVYVSIHFYGGASTLFAGLLTFIFVSFLALVFSLPWLVLSTRFYRTPGTFIIAFASIWMLGEWLRSWLLTGFPWLYLGYGHQATWLSGWAPVIGVFGIGFIIALSGAVIVHTLRTRTAKQTISYSLLLAVFWGSGIFLKTIAWTQVSQQAIQVAQVQPNIAQDIKWQASYAQPTLTLLSDMSSKLWQNDWIIWPEAAVPFTYQEAMPFLTKLNQQAEDTNTGLITGIIYDDLRTQRYYNSIAGFGNALGIYHKRRLVPFGEYVPLENWLRGVIELFDLPTSIISIGPKNQRGLRVKQIDIAPAVCYELAYPDLIAETAKNTQVLLSVSNLGWFGDSIGPPQFLQMGQMRALETGRYLIYNTNNGTSALINELGEITAQTQAAVAQTLTGAIYPATGITPFMHWGSKPMVAISLLLLLATAWIKRQSSLREKTWI